MDAPKVEVKQVSEAELRMHEYRIVNDIIRGETVLTRRQANALADKIMRFVWQSRSNYGKA